MEKKISADNARDMLLSLPIKKNTEMISLKDSCGRVNVVDIYSKEMVPPFDRSPYDGYAFRGEDTIGATQEEPVILLITEEIQAGKEPKFEIKPGYAAKILTGAPIPKGANATIKYESIEFTDTNVKISAPVAPYTNVVFAGEDIPSENLVVKAGTVITPPIMGVLAAVGVPMIQVHKKPTVTIINTGTELIPVDVPLKSAKIRNSNFYTLSGYLTETGFIVKNGGIITDELDAITSKIKATLDNSDMVITTGGASVGDYDWTLTAVEKLEAEVLFWKINMKPGGSTLAAVLDGKLILGLSGSPGAAIVALMRVAMPYIKKLSGRIDVLPQPIVTVLKEPLNKKSPSMRMLRGELKIENSIAYFKQHEGQGNGIVSSFINCDLLGEVPEGSPELQVGTKIKSYRI